MAAVVKSQFSNPFAAVDIQPVAVAGEQVPSRIAVRVQDDHGAYQVQGILGRDYQLLPNRKVRDVAEDIMSRAPTDFGGFRNLKTLWDGKRYVDYFATNNPIATANGKYSPLNLNLGLMVWNSYDGTRKVGFEVFCLNPFCTNQYHSRNRFGFFAWRHDPNEAGKIDVDEAMQNISIGVSNIVRVAPAIQELKAKVLTVEMVQAAKAKTDLPQSRWGDVLDALSGEDGSAFGLFQAMTNVASHKLSGLSAVATGTSVTEHFLALPAPSVVHHATAEQVLAERNVA
jgi:hypothetical protein